MRSFIEILKKQKFLIIIIFIYGILFTVDPQKGLTALRISFSSLISVLLIVIAVFIFVGLFHVWIKEDFIVKHLGEESGIRGFVLGALFGTALHGPLFSIFPLLQSLLKRGAKLGVLVIVFSTYAIKIPMIPLEIRFLGLKFTLIHNLLLALIAFIAVPSMEWLMGGHPIDELLED